VLNEIQLVQEKPYWVKKVGSSTQKVQKYGHLTLKPIEKPDVWFERWFKRYKKANQSDKYIKA